MRDAFIQIWAVTWRVSLALFILVVLFVICDVAWLVYPWREHNVPLRIGMTVEELGRARPGRYISTPLPSLRPLGRARASELATFTGELRVHTPSGTIVELPIEGGYRMEADDGDATDPAIEAAFPSDLRLDFAATRVRPDLIADLVILSTRETDYDLPRDTPRLSRYTGRLWGREYAGMTHYRWRAEFVRGRAVEIQEWTEGD